MTHFQKMMGVAAAGIVLAGLSLGIHAAPAGRHLGNAIRTGRVRTRRAFQLDESKPLASYPVPAARAESSWCASLTCGSSPGNAEWRQAPATPAPVISAAGAAVEQTSQGTRPALSVLDRFTGLGIGFFGPQGAMSRSNPSDNSLAVGPNDIVQIVNSDFAVYTKKGAKYAKTGKPIYGPVPTNEIFHGFGGPCASNNDGDAVVRYDQLANRWLFVLPVFRPIPARTPHRNVPPAQSGRPALPGLPSVSGAPVAPREHPPTAISFFGPAVHGTYAVCYAVSTTSNPLGSYYRYAFSRKHFPDYPRPAVWPNGYYVATSSGDTVIQKQVCVADRSRMLKGEPATEQCIVINGVNFLNPADIDGRTLPPPGSPELVFAAGGTQLKGIFRSHSIYYWKVHVDWRKPSETSLAGPFRIPVAPYHYLCNGQLTSCVPQPGTGTHLDAQGDKLMQRVVYRRIDNKQWIVAAQSVDTSAGGGGVRWYEFELNSHFDPRLYQEGTYVPDGNFRWMPSIDIDRAGDIGVGYSFGGPHHFVGQRFAARKANDPLGKLTFHESVLVHGQAAQIVDERWEDYTTTAMDPSNGCTFWYVGDYLRKYQLHYSTVIGAFRVPGCEDRK